MFESEIYPIYFTSKTTINLLTSQCVISLLYYFNQFSVKVPRTWLRLSTKVSRFKTIHLLKSHLYCSVTIFMMTKKLNHDVSEQSRS